MSSRVTRSRAQQALLQAEESQVGWTNDVTTVFVDLMVEQVRKGSKVDGSFSKKTWNSIRNGFYQMAGLPWEIEKLKNRCAVLRRQYAIVKSLLQHGEFRFDSPSGFVVGSDAAWRDVIKGYPDAEAIRRCGFPFYEQLHIIFSDKYDEAGEEEVELPPSVSADAEMHRANLVEADTPLFALNKEPLLVVKEEAPTSASEDIAGGQFLSLMNTTISNRKRGRKGVDDAIAEAILQMAAAAKLKTAILTRIDARYSIADCIKELDKIEGDKGDFYFAALDLFNKPVAREIFLSLKGEKRLTWLRHKCSQHVG